MFFLNPWLLLGLLGISIPLFLHLFNRRKSSLIKWGAQMFLAASLAERRKRIMVEEILLLATRSLIFAFAALAFARPYASQGNGVVWMATAFAALAAVVGAAFAAVSWSNRLLRKRILIAVAALAFFAGATAATDGIRNYIRASRAGAKDVAIILDASSSMTIRSADGKTAFERAKEEIDDFIDSSPRNTAFSIILGGAVPEALTANPISDRKILYRLLDEARPLEGTFRAADALALSASVLTKGVNSTKQFVVFGDGQSAGWDIGDEQTWSYVKDVVGRLPGEPRIVWRTLGLPDKLRNLTVSSLSFSRGVIGTDREVRIDAVVANNGDEAATAGALVLSTEGRSYTDTTIGQLQPGERRLVSFRHRFRKAGTHAVRANLDIADDLSGDNSMTQIAVVRPSMKVLVVEGARGRRLSERPGAFIALSLAPVAEDSKASGNSRNPFLVKPVVVDAVDLASVEDFSEFSAIVLADVARLSTNVSSRLIDYVEMGGGIMAVCAGRSRPDFYNGLVDSDGVMAMPLRLEGDSPSGLDGIPVDPGAISHASVALLAKDGDLGSAVFEQCWQTSVSDAPDVSVGARLVDGNALFAERKLGRGRIIQFAAALDPASGNLISRQSFLPMVHELTYYLARPVVPNLNLELSSGGVLTLGGNVSEAKKMAMTGLRGLYYANDKNGKLLAVSNDSMKDFAWRNEPIVKNYPSNGKVYAIWTGSLTVPRSGVYTFTVSTRGQATISFPKHKKHFGLRRSRITVDLEAGVQHDVVIVYSGLNFIRGNYLSLSWNLRDNLLSRLSPIRKQDRGWVESFPAEIISQRGSLDATLRVTDEALSIHFPHRLAPGVYNAAVPAFFAPELSSLGALSNGFVNVLFNVAADSSESILNAPTADEVAFISRQSDIAVASTEEEFTRAIGGASVGEELWRRAAIPLLFLLVAEIFLTRWITKQRRIGEEGSVNFEDGNKPSSRFAEILEAMKGGKL